ncbi:MAG: InlB B-repeat-containing protein [Clostridiales Family XIII bacterium]|jgi:uncharacterized repeat protein (TIGR02543 family)|nr:InlB B-repeat-containing protein [Clostridiales Family XIII bacterium]
MKSRSRKASGKLRGLAWLISAAMALTTLFGAGSAAFATEGADPNTPPAMATITLDGNGGTFEGVDADGDGAADARTTVEAEVGVWYDVSKAPKPVRTGFSFVGWGLTSTAKESKAIEEIGPVLAEGHILYAIWTEAQYKITFNGNKGKAQQFKTLSLKSGSVYGTLPTGVRKGYKFLGWYTKKSGGKKVYTTTKFKGKANQTLYAHWKKQSGGMPDLAVETTLAMTGSGSGYHAKIVIGTASSAISFGFFYDEGSGRPAAGSQEIFFESVYNGGANFTVNGYGTVSPGSKHRIRLEIYNSSKTAKGYVDGKYVGSAPTNKMGGGGYIDLLALSKYSGESVNATFADTTVYGPKFGFGGFTGGESHFGSWTAKKTTKKTSKKNDGTYSYFGYGETWKLSGTASMGGGNWGDLEYQNVGVRKRMPIW